MVAPVISEVQTIVETATASATNNSFLSALFKTALLYSVVIFLLSLLTLNKDRNEDLQKQWSELYANHTERLIAEHKKQQEALRGKNQLQRAGILAKLFLSRPGILAGIVFCGTLLRHYSDPILSMLLSYGMGGYLAFNIKKYDSKFLPGLAIGLSMCYGVMHHLGWNNGWHTQVGI